MNETRAYIDSNTKDTKDLNIKNEQPGDHFDHPDWCNGIYTRHQRRNHNIKTQKNHHFNNDVDNETIVDYDADPDDIDDESNSKLDDTTDNDNDYDDYDNGDYHNAEENKANMPPVDDNNNTIPNSIANNLGPFWSSPTSSR